LEISHYGEAMARVVILGLVVVMVAFGVLFVALAIRFREEGRAVVAWGLAYGGFHIALAAVVVAGVWLPAAQWYAVGTWGAFLLAKQAAGRRLRREEERVSNTGRRPT
jgi:uncharacterized membrane protein